MKVNEIVVEGLYDVLTKGAQAIDSRNYYKQQQQQIATHAQQQRAAQAAAQAQAQVAGQFKTNPARATTTEPANTEPVPQNQRVLDPEVEVVSTVDPIILLYKPKNQRYTRQPNGQWTKLGQTKPIDLPMQQFLNSELAKL